MFIGTKTFCELKIHDCQLHAAIAMSHMEPLHATYSLRYKPLLSPSYMSAVHPTDSISVGVCYAEHVWVKHQDYSIQDFNS